MWKRKISTILFWPLKFAVSYPIDALNPSSFSFFFLKVFQSSVSSSPAHSVVLCAVMWHCCHSPREDVDNRESPLLLFPKTESVCGFQSFITSEIVRTAFFVMIEYALFFSMFHSTFAPQGNLINEMELSFLFRTAGIGISLKTK